MLLDARKYVEYKVKEQRRKVRSKNKIPHLVILQVQGDPASERYVRNKINRCTEVGVDIQVYSFINSVEQHIVEEKIHELNNDDSVTGILLQLPLPPQLDEYYLTNLIIPEKDVDGFTELNTGKLSLGSNCNKPCTARGVMDLLKFHGISVTGKDVLIINRSNIVGKPLAQLMLRENATVTIAHSKTEYLKEKIKDADIVVTGVGIPNFLTNEDFSDSTVIIDISINFVDGKMCGDVCKADYDILAERCDLTPVPYGVGQTTVIALIDNLLDMC